MPFRPMKNMKNILDGHERQLKSPKSKKFRGVNHDTLA